MNDQPIYLQTDGPVAEIVLNRPAKRNALNKEIWERIPELIQTVADDPSLTVVVIRGSTEKAFTAGADISEFDVLFATPESAKAYEHTIRRAYDSFRQLDKPIIALIQGFCFGGGCALALNCDIRYADPSARFCIPPARLGIAYTLFETKRLCDIVGPSKTSEMLMGARVIEAEEALGVGLVTRLFPAADLHRQTMDFARSLSGLSQFTIRSVKTMVREIVDGAVDDNDVSRALFEQQFKGQDYLEGRRAFMEKRPPKFTYR